MFLSITFFSFFISTIGATWIILQARHTHSIVKNCFYTFVVRAVRCGMAQHVTHRHEMNKCPMSCKQDNARVRLSLRKTYRLQRDQAYTLKGETRKKADEISVEHVTHLFLSFFMNKKQKWKVFAYLHTLNFDYIIRMTITRLQSGLCWKQASEREREKI